jgi:hypothetical protein
MGEQLRFATRDPTQPMFRPTSMTTKPLVFPACPVDQSTVHVSEYRIQGRFIKPTKVVDPSTDHRIEHARKVFNGLVRFQMNPPISYLIAHGLGSLIAGPGSEVDEKLTHYILMRYESVVAKSKYVLFPV